MNKRLCKKLKGRVGGHHPAWYVRRLRKDLNTNPPGWITFVSAAKSNYNNVLCQAVYKAFGRKAANEFADTLGW